MPSPQTHQSHSKGGRLETRVSVAQKNLFRRAAELQGYTLTDFVIATLQNAASEIIREHEVMTLSGKDREVFVAALLIHPCRTTG